MVDFACENYWQVLELDQPEILKVSNSDSDSSNSDSDSDCSSRENENWIYKEQDRKREPSDMFNKIEDIEIAIENETVADRQTRNLIFDALKIKRQERNKQDFVYKYQISPDKDYAIATTRSREHLINTLMDCLCNLSEFQPGITIEEIDQRVFVHVSASHHMNFYISNVFAGGMQMLFDIGSFHIFDNLKVICRDSRYFSESISVPMSTIRYARFSKYVGECKLTTTHAWNIVLDYCFETLPFSTLLQILFQKVKEEND